MLKKNYKKQILRSAPAFVPQFFNLGILGLRRGKAGQALRRTPSFAKATEGKAGQAAISFMMIMGGIIVLIALLLSLYGLSFLSGSYGIALSQRAYFVAYSGFSDAFLQFLRTKDISSSQYSAIVGSASTLITITTDTPAIGQVTITSVASVVGFSRTVSGVLSVNSSTGAVSIISLAHE